MKKQMKVTLIVIVAAIIVAAAIYIVRYIKSGNDLLTPGWHKGRVCWRYGQVSVYAPHKGSADSECRRRAGCAKGCHGS